MIYIQIYQVHLDRGLVKVPAVLAVEVISMVWVAAKHQWFFLDYEMALVA